MMRMMAAAAVVLALGGCTANFEARFSEELVDFGGGPWVDGIPDDSESVFIVNDSRSESFWVHELELTGDQAAAFTIEIAREGVDLPYEIPPEVGSEILITFAGTPDGGAEQFDAVLEATVGPPSRGARVRASMAVPLTAAMICDKDEDGDPFEGCGGADCDEDDPTRASTFTELCNGQDDDCTGAPDADPQGEVDIDFDDFLSCEDCDDSDPFINPDADEACDGVDNDCNGLADHPDGGEGDADGDGVLACNDCDDNDPDIGAFGCR